MPAQQQQKKQQEQEEQEQEQEQQHSGLVQRALMHPAAGVSSRASPCHLQRALLQILWIH